LESLLRNLDGKKVTEADVKNLANWNAKSPGEYEIPFTVTRIVLQDFTGPPAAPPPWPSASPWCSCWEPWPCS